MKWSKPIMLCLLSLAALAEDGRVLVELPPMMREHMLHNMRDPLETLRGIVGHLGQADYEGAAELAEGRLGMSAMQAPPCATPPAGSPGPRALPRCAATR